MKFVITILFALTTCVANGQETETSNLINDIYLNVVPAQFEYYNLVDAGFVTEFDKYSLEESELNKLLTLYPDFPFDYFLHKKKDSLLIKWRNYDLTKARIYKYDSIPKY